MGSGCIDGSWAASMPSDSGHSPMYSMLYWKVRASKGVEGVPRVFHHLGPLAEEWYIYRYGRVHAGG